MRSLQSQSLTIPLLVSCTLVLCFHVPLCWALVFKLKLGIVGGAVAFSLSNWLYLILVVLYVKFSPIGKNTHVTISMDAFVGIKEFFWFAVPSAVMICCRQFIGKVYSNEKPVVSYVASMAPFISLSIITESLQAVISGIAKGSGWQHIGAYVNLGAFYLFGIPAAVVLGFPLHLRAKGFWIGIVIGSVILSIGLLYNTTFSGNSGERTNVKRDIRRHGYRLIKSAQSQVTWTGKNLLSIQIIALALPGLIMMSMGESPDFLVTCDRSNGNPTPYYLRKKSDFVITNMSTSTSEMEVLTFVAHDCYDNVSNNTYNDPSLTLSSFRISTKNRFVAIGCDTYGYIKGTIGNVSDSTGCRTTCGTSSHITNGSCSGIGCCEVAIPEGMSSYDLFARSFDNHTNITDFNPCSHAFVVNEGKFNFSSISLLKFGNVEKMPMLLDWAIGNDSCDVAKLNTNFLCKGNSECDEDYEGTGYRCRCKNGFEGNPYVSCKNINECAHPDTNECVHGHDCINTEGSYRCSCRKGYFGDGWKNGTSCTPKPGDQSLVIKIAICASTAIILLLVLVSWVYVGVKKRKGMMLREKFFKQNGGIMLQQRIGGDGGAYNRQKVLYSTEDLKRATNNYNESRIIGKGGYGTVYKGFLSDNRIVAIKKSKLADQTQSQIEQFINEVVILSQINHRNVVKLIGCCLETEVPSLVYEFIPNGTLSDHIHNENKSLAFTWEIRLRIAAETAGALLYLHSAASVPIIHRDTELATIVQGTLGYLDPEYLQQNQLTDKSDVYSFGVVLVELLTGRKALSFDRPEKERNLAMYFLSSLKEGRLFQVLDANLQLNEVPNEIIQVSRLAEKCLSVKGDERPTMKEVAIEPEGILASMIHKHPWVKSTSNEDEAVHLLKQATDDYEYTGGANGSSRTFDSMSKQPILPIASGSLCVTLWITSSYWIREEGIIQLGGGHYEKNKDFMLGLSYSTQRW
ncbi:putative wall-associated receptor kinase-like protein 16 [Tanacetum coccineum]